MSKGKKLFDDFLASVSKNIGVMQISFGEMIIIKTQQSILLDYIAELEAENRWIPVSERLPKEKGE